VGADRPRGHHRSRPTRLRPGRPRPLTSGTRHDHRSPPGCPACAGAGSASPARWPKPRPRCARPTSARPSRSSTGASLERMRATRTDGRRSPPRRWHSTSHTFKQLSGSNIDRTCVPVPPPLPNYSRPLTSDDTSVCVQIRPSPAERGLIVHLCRDARSRCRQPGPEGPRGTLAGCRGAPRPGTGHPTHSRPVSNARRYDQICANEP